MDNFDSNINERLIYSLFNIIDQDNKYLIINSLIPINQINFDLDDLKSRANNCLFAEIGKPDDELMFALILKNFSDRQIVIDKKLIDFIIKRIDRSYSKISEFIYKRTYSRWMEEEIRREVWPETIERFLSFINSERTDI